ncbi:hypothetical protein C9439_01800 [archaeon SCG-AAA382B04]|nr:hypothetical protein C9439_01800 [archaeon SCG-AAA382B04]
MYDSDEILETLKMVSTENLDIRTVTLGINLRGCSDPDLDTFLEKIETKIIQESNKLVEKAEKIEKKYGIPIVNKRISVTPISEVIGPNEDRDIEEIIRVAKKMDEVAERVGVDFIGGYSAFVHKGITNSDEKLIESIPKALGSTKRVCSAINVATTKAGINMNAVNQIGEIIKQTAQETKEQNGLGCAKLAIFVNSPLDNPFMPGAMHGAGEAESSLSVAISGPGVVKSVIENQKETDFGELSEKIKRTAFKITRAGELIGREVAQEIGTQFNIVDLSLAPTPAEGDSVARIIEEMGVERCGAPGSTAALAMLTDSVKKGGAMATSHIGGLSGSFIPVTEDAGMADAVKDKSMSIEKLEAMTSVCSVGLDMVPIPGDTSVETISGIIADECSIGVINDKSIGVRLIPVPGAEAGGIVEFGGLLGESPIIKVSDFGCKDFVDRNGRIPSPIHSLTN